MPYDPTAKNNPNLPPSVYAMAETMQDIIALNGPPFHDLKPEPITTETVFDKGPTPASPLLKEDIVKFAAMVKAKQQSLTTYQQKNYYMHHDTSQQPMSYSPIPEMDMGRLKQEAYHYIRSRFDSMRGRPVTMEQGSVYEALIDFTARYLSQQNYAFERIVRNKTEAYETKIQHMQLQLDAAKNRASLCEMAVLSTGRQFRNEE